MGIYNRDYMKRPSDDDEERASDEDIKLAVIFRRVFKKYPRLLLYLGVALVALVTIAIVVAK